MKNNFPVSLLLMFMGAILFISCDDPAVEPAKEVQAEELGNFKFVQYDTSYTGNEDFVVLEGDIISLATEDIRITLTRVTHQKPDDWVTAFCVGPACYPEFLSTVSFDLAAGDTANFSLDTFPNGNAGTGDWTIFAVDSTTMEVDSVHISMEVIIASS